jgi:hypothetical protein
MNKLLKPLSVILGLGLLGALVGTGAALLPRFYKPAGDSVPSGPQVEEEVPGPFYPMTYNGSKAGQKDCQFCKNEDHPVVMVFARALTEPVTTLIRELDASTVAHADAEMGSCVIFLSDDKELPSRLKELAGKEKIQHTILAVYPPTGPPKYKINTNADVTVLLYTKTVVKANHAFGKGQMTDSDVDKILKDLSKILGQG